MTTISTTPTSPPSELRRLVRIIAAESKAELLKLIRMPSFVIFALAFPVMFYILFGLAFGAGRSAGGTTYAAYMIASYGTFGVMGAALVGLGIGIATERGQGWLVVKRASPMPATAYFVAKTAMSMVFSAVIVALLFLLAATMGGVRMSIVSWVTLMGVLVAGAIPFCAIGCALGFAAGPNSAPAVANLIHLPMAFVSGLWIPIEVLPPFFQRVAPFFPAYHLAQLALGVVDGTYSGLGRHFVALGVFTLIFAAVATVAYRRDEGKTYG